MPRGRIKRDTYLNVLSEKKENRIHEASLEILEKTGVRVQDEETLSRLEGEGCRVDYKTQTAKMDESFIMKGLKKHPKEFLLRAVEPEQDCCLTSGNSLLVTTSPGMSSVDLDTWEPRLPLPGEYYEYMRVIHGLEEIDLAGSFPWSGFQGVPECMRLIEGFAAKIRCSGKALWEGSTMDNYKFMVTMARKLGADVWMNTNPTSPLTFSKATMEQMKYFCEKDVVFTLTSGPIPGVSSPVTLAGTLALNNADILAGNAIAQMYAPGCRCMAGGMILTLNMNTGAPLFANAASYLSEAAFTQMWRRYQIPCVTNAPGWSNAKSIDYQAAYETSTGFLMLALAGASVIPYAGGLTAELTAHPVKAIIDADVAKMVRRILEGIAVEKDTLAVSLIDEIGFAPASYLAEEHTVDWYKKERCDLELADTDTILDWLERGRSTLIERGKEKMDKLLFDAPAYRLNQGQENAVKEILEEAREYYRGKGAIQPEEWKVYKGALDPLER